MAGLDSVVDIGKDPPTAPGAPQDTAGEESEGEEDAVDSLSGGAGETELVAEPVDVEKRR